MPVKPAQCRTRTTRTELSERSCCCALVGATLSVVFQSQRAASGSVVPLFTLRLAHASDKVTVYHPDKSPLKFGCPVDKSTVHSQPLNTEFIEPTHRDEIPVAVVQF
jgi:hypothetical protein